MAQGHISLSSSQLEIGEGGEFTSENISVPAFPEEPTSQEDEVVKALSLESRGQASSWR
jgi:hypothetical protein